MERQLDSYDKRLENPPQPLTCALSQSMACFCAAARKAIERPVMTAQHQEHRSDFLAIREECPDRRNHELLDLVGLRAKPLRFCRFPHAL